jgi:hypothetical protein
MPVLRYVFKRIRLHEGIAGVSRLLAVVDAGHVKARHLVSTGGAASAAKEIQQAWRVHGACTKGRESVGDAVEVRHG